jgi:hypothetical protein
MNYCRVLPRREAKAFAADRPAGTREALPGSMSLRDERNDVRACARLFVATASASMN